MKDYQRVVAEIDLDAIAHNIEHIRAITDKSAKLMGIVKADAYGHGAIEVAKTLLFHGADWLGVAMADEAVQLRKNNIHVPILILGYTPQADMEEVVHNDIIQTIFSYEDACELSAAAVKHGKTTKIHIKIDSGMGRIGFLPQEDAILQIERIGCLPGIELNGIYTHFSTSDEMDKTYTIYQYEKFKFMIERLAQRGIHFPVKHCANSAAVMEMGSQFSFDLVRPGIILYGMYPSDVVKKEVLELHPAMRLKSQVSFVKEVEAGTAIGYGRTFITQQKSRIATVPVGYADGYLRKMAQGGRVIVNGCYAPIVGRICMDQFMIDVTKVEGVKPGDVVTLMGKSAGKEITAEEIADILDTINYEVVCMIGKRVPREYYKNKVAIKTVNFIN